MLRYTGCKAKQTKKTGRLSIVHFSTRPILALREARACFTQSLKTILHCCLWNTYTYMYSTSDWQWPSFVLSRETTLQWTAHTALDNLYCTVVHTALFPFCTVVHAVLDNPHCSGQFILPCCSYCTLSILHCCPRCTGQPILHWTIYTAKLFILHFFHSALLSMLYWTTNNALDNSHCIWQTALHLTNHTALGSPYYTIWHDPHHTGQSILHCAVHTALNSSYCMGQSILHWTVHTAHKSILHWTVHTAQGSPYCTGQFILHWAVDTTLNSWYCIEQFMLHWTVHTALNSPYCTGSPSCTGQSILHWYCTG